MTNNTFDDYFILKCYWEQICKTFFFVIIKSFNIKIVPVFCTNGMHASDIMTNIIGVQGYFFSTDVLNII